MRLFLVLLVPPLGHASPLGGLDIGTTAAVSSVHIVLTLQLAGAISATYSLHVISLFLNILILVGWLRSLMQPLLLRLLLVSPIHQLFHF